MRRSVAKSLGTQFNLNPNLGNRWAGSGTANNALTASRGQMNINFFGSSQLGFSVMIEALESQGMVRTLSEPSLTTLSGQEAKFLAGGEYPIPVSSRDGVSIEYKPFGVELNFTPYVLDGGVINLQLNAAVSGIDSAVTVGLAGGLSVNAFRRRETSTTVEMRDGESFAIAGLLQDDFRDAKGQVPWIGDIPILGALFRSADYQREQSELVIIVTAHLVSPTRGEALALPTDRVRPPSERELFLYGQVVGGQSTRPQTGAAGEVARQDFSGPYGYVMD
jgi:pilus assembly protein CpaC